MKYSEIGWTQPGGTFNGWIGCTKIDQECKSCYAEVLIDQRYGANKAKRWGVGASRTKTNKSQWAAVRKWNTDAGASGEPFFVFCGSLMDVMDEHDSIQGSWRDELYQLITDTPNLTWLLLTKRPENYAGYLDGRQLNWPHVWLGTSCGHDGAKALGRVKALQATPIHPSAKRFISAEPLLAGLGDIDLSGIGWVITGGESGKGSNIRPFDLAHAWNLYQSCKRQSVPFWLKQLGEITVDDGKPVERTSHIHDLCDVPEKYAEMIRRERPDSMASNLPSISLPSEQPKLELNSAIQIESDGVLDSRLTKWMSGQLASPTVVARESLLRADLISGLSMNRRSRYVLGRVFVEYRELFKGNYIGMLSAVGYSRFTARDIIADYERVRDSKVSEQVRMIALNQGVDLAEAKHKAILLKLSQQGSESVDLEATVKQIIAENKAEKRQVKAKVTKNPSELVQIKLSAETNLNPEIANLEVQVKSLIDEDEWNKVYRQWLYAMLADLSKPLADAA